MKKRNLIFVLISFCLLAGMKKSLAVDHGSLKVTGTALYPQRNGAVAGVAVPGVTLDFKVVTIGSTTWAWTNLSAYGISGAEWGSQLRWWQPGKTENNLLERVAGTPQTYGKTTNLPTQTPVTITVFQALEGAPEGYTETDDFSYDYTAQNSAVEGDETAPVLAEPIVQAQEATSITLQLSATDDNDYFYYITDAENGLEVVSFIDLITIPLVAGQAYNLSVVAIDFNGNTSAAKTVPIGAQAITNIVEGTAQAVKFKLDSRSNDELVVYVENEDFLFGDAYVKMKINSVSILGERKPTNLSAGGAHAYRVVYNKNEIPDWAPDVVLELSFGYVAYSYPENIWGNYVNDLATITEGENVGKPILHKIGTGVDIVLPTAIAKVDVTPKTATITTGGKVQLTAVAKTALNDPVENATYTWEVDSENATISATGEFTSQTAGTYTVTATVTGTEFTNTATITVEPLSLVSAYCDAPIGSGAAVAKISFSTRRDGRVVVEISPDDPTAEDIDAGTFTAFRNKGWADGVVAQITVNGDVNTAYKYFTRSHNGAGDGDHDAAKTKLYLVPVEGMMHVGDIIKVNNLILEYETPGNNNAYPNLTFTFTYGSYCGDEPNVLPEVTSVTTATVTETEASVTVVAAPGDFALATVTFTEDNALIPPQTFPVAAGDLYTLTGLTAETSYSFAVSVTDIEGNSSEAFANKWTFTTSKITALSGVKADAVGVYPVPAQEILYINGISAPEKVRIADITGKTVHTQLSSGTVDVSNLASGIYFLQVKNSVVKIIKQ
jgi:hypothetical protein